jgi:hypothetical protein
MQAADVTKAGQSATGRDDSLRLRLAPLAPAKESLFDNVERQLQTLCGPAPVPAKPQPRPRVAKPKTLPRKRRAKPRPPAAAPRDRDETTAVHIAVIVAAGIAAFGLGWIGATNVSRLLAQRGGQPAIGTVVERIIDAESSGIVDAKNERSSATGLGQFIDETWLRMIHKYRPDLAEGLDRDETLALRQQADVAREMTTRFAERHAALLRTHALPVTAGTLYLAHFAGGRGAVALLTAPDAADAATVMAKADASGRIKREQIVKANPFLDKFTVADLKQWAERKMAVQRPASLVVAKAKQ